MSRTDKQTIKLVIRTDAQLADALSDYLIGMFDAAVEFQVGGSGETTVHGFMQREVSTEDGLAPLVHQVAKYGSELAAVFGCKTPAVSFETIDNQDWSEKWKEHFRAFEIIPGLIIAPTWEPNFTGDGQQVIRMDPGMAFGTGHHETTRLCLEMLSDLESITTGATLLDVGTGTGILGMAALLFGAANVVALDNDEEAVRAARANAAINRLSDRMEVSSTPLAQVAGSYQVVVANIIHDVLLDLSDDLVRLVEPGGTLVLSGLIFGAQSDNIARVFQQKGCRLVQHSHDGQWAALQLLVPELTEAG